MEDTIAAISTPVGEGGIAIVRISGPLAFAIADQVFISRSGRPSSYPTHTIHFGKISWDGVILDHVMLSAMRAPRSYTTEDTIEINCHGGMLPARGILTVCLQAGARLAQPGEFTKLAFLNGRIDLTQAESVMDLIAAKTQRAHSAAIHALEGHLSKRLEVIRQRLLIADSHIEAQIDFPEEEISPETHCGLMNELASIVTSLREIHATAKEGKILRTGFVVTVIGRPNAGKSSLLNVLLGQDRSIVTPIPGTTRDTIQEFVSIHGIPMLLTDTAGFRTARSQAEAHGVNRTLKALRSSDLVLHVIDQSRPYSPADLDLVKHSQEKQALRVLNKIDLPRRFRAPKAFPNDPFLSVSCLSGFGVDDLRQALAAAALSVLPDSMQLDVVINERQSEALRNTLNCLTCGLDVLKNMTDLAIVSQHLRFGLTHLGEIVGKTTTEDILEKIFSSFCIGK